MREMDLLESNFAYIVKDCCLVIVEMDFMNLLNVKIISNSINHFLE